MLNRKYVVLLEEWIKSLEGIESYIDKYDNICYGTSKQKHIVHLHSYNLHADIEVNNSFKFKDYLRRYDVGFHEFEPEKWLIVDVKDWDNYSIAKEMICSAYDS